MPGFSERCNQANRVNAQTSIANEIDSMISLANKVTKEPQNESQLRNMASSVASPHIRNKLSREEMPTVSGTPTMPAVRLFRVSIATIAIAICSMQFVYAYDEKELDSWLNGNGPRTSATQIETTGLRSKTPIGNSSKTNGNTQAPNANAQKATPIAPETTGNATGVQHAAAAPQSAATADKFANLSTVVPNFRIVSGDILRGGQPTAEAMSALKAAGVRTIINLRNEEVLVRKEAAQARALGMQFVNIPLDVFNPPSEKAKKDFLAILSNPAAQPIYIHCLHGQDRTGTMVALYRISKEGWTADRAYAEMVSCGFRPGFRQLSDAVFDAGARLGRGGTRPNGASIVDDLKSRLSRSNK